ncbi:DUF1700 domain-containing protein [Cohnella endophytica]|uniref:DUF1700 domain-containing protein n=1 Tax=Cohnella endophytica TaxID=2419778 RepID=A0A494XA19_9BACL|nr:DUF1700 domain-containing protein [Cohnella endophytica]RKP47350.1 DUF1700 domain-containing protein [Cohnella endophytica]
MNKQQFIDSLGHYFASLPEQDQLAILRDYEAHFQQGELEGKSEDQIAYELGHPLSVAKDALFVGSAYDFRPAPAKPDYPRLIGVSIALFFLNVMFAIPVFASVWAAFVSVCAVALSGLLSPILLGFETAWYGDFTYHKLMFAAGMLGLGMLLAGGAYALGKLLGAVTIRYARWNYKTWRGRL